MCVDGKWPFKREAEKVFNFPNVSPFDTMGRVVPGGSSWEKRQAGEDFLGQPQVVSSGQDPCEIYPSECRKSRRKSFANTGHNRSALVQK